MSRPGLDDQMAARFAGAALGHVAREYPHKFEHAAESDDDIAPPRALHPAFFGSYDWHSCVHGWWTLLTLRRLFGEAPEAGAIEALADETFRPDKIAVETAYFERPVSRTFERPYGWAWLLALHQEAALHDGHPWAEAIAPLARTIAGRFRDFLPLLTYPVRSGAHFNTAFALALALPWAERFDPPLAQTIGERARHWFMGDRNCPAWEPSGDDFLSPALCEALLMARVLPRPEFSGWLSAFLPHLDAGEPATLFRPAAVSDRSDGKIAHLDGLNLSRAWCWRSLEPLLAPAEQPIARNAADAHLSAALPHVTGDYMGEHWLASFALLALLA
jgi:hypothetical protein